MSSTENREVRLPLGVIVERRPSQHPWADYVWSPVGVYLGGARRPPWEILRQDGGTIRFHAGTPDLVLHRKETEALRQNLAKDRPELYVVLHESTDPDAPAPYVVHTVTASPFEAQDHSDTEGALLGKVPMPEAVAAFIQAFIEAHHTDEEFRKRRRDRPDPDEQKFGKSPIFSHITRQ